MDSNNIFAIPLLYFLCLSLITVSVTFSTSVSYSLFLANSAYLCLPLLLSPSIAHCLVSVSSSSPYILCPYLAFFPSPTLSFPIFALSLPMCNSGSLDHSHCHTHTHSPALPLSLSHFLTLITFSVVHSLSLCPPISLILSLIFPLSQTL